VLSFKAAGFPMAWLSAGMMATTAMQLAIDAFGPIADNAGGISPKCASCSKKCKERTDILTPGNTTAATGRASPLPQLPSPRWRCFCGLSWARAIHNID
jgi:K(+)-stimulated pyrophosphate-energized sodium pump